MLPGPPIDPAAPVVAPLAASTAVLVGMSATLLGLVLAAAVGLTPPGGALLVAAVGAGSAAYGARLMQRHTRPRDIVELPDAARLLPATGACRGQVVRSAAGFAAYAGAPFVMHGSARVTALCFGAYIVGRPLGAYATNLRAIRRVEEQDGRTLFVIPRRDAAVLYGKRPS